jgi:uncharacterized protein
MRVITAAVFALELLGAGPFADAPQLQAAQQVDTVAYTAESVRLSVTGAVLGGTLYLPASPGPHPAAVLLPGARDSRFLPGIADALARRGIAVLDLDKRGVGASTGRWDRQPFQGRARDAAAALALLRGHEAIDPARLGLVGHSQGGWIAQMVASQDAGVAFVVLLAAPAQTVRDQILTYERIQHERRGASAAEVERALASLRRQLSLAGGIRPVCRALRLHYICQIIDFDPAPWIARLRTPVLALYGELDPMVPPDLNIPLLREGLSRAGNPDVTIHVFARANHDFFEARTGLWDEYHELSREYVDGFVDMITDWVGARTSVAPRTPAAPCAPPAAHTAAGTSRSALSVLDPDEDAAPVEDPHDAQPQQHEADGVGERRVDRAGPGQV